jgi:hypothetical protein
MAFATSSVTALRGALCPTTCRPGRLFINSLNAGLLQVALNLLPRISAPSSVWLLVEMLTPDGDY